MDELIRQILTARVYEVAVRSPLEQAHGLSAQTGCTVLLKREDLQPCFSFKVRGAHNRIAALGPEQHQRGVICVSAGNHAQGVALSARTLGIHATVVMPNTTPRIKVEAVRALGAEVVLHGDTFNEAAAHCSKLQAESGRTFIHPFDDPLVIAGQGTVGYEILQQAPDVDVVYVPIGGGGLISGIAAYLKALRPQCRVVGVQPEDSDAMRRSVERVERVALEHVGLFADGVAVKQVGEHTFGIVRRCVDEIITVSTDQICSAIKSIYEETRSIVEPAGALAVAGLRKHLAAAEWRGATAVAVNSGANMNFDRLQFVAERSLVGEQREALFAVTIPERPGALRAFCNDVVAERNITEFNYRLHGRAEAHIFVGVGVRSDAERRAFGEALHAAGFAYMDLTDNELAKTHIRHMVGGRAEARQNEVLYRFRFPERPKALLDFLDAMSEGWNISLFHYRMHGADFGRVLVGFEIPAGEEEAFGAFLARTGYAYTDESHNPAYELFL